MIELLQEQIDIINRLNELGKEYLTLGGSPVKNPNYKTEVKLINILKVRYEKNERAIAEGYKKIKC